MGLDEFMAFVLVLVRVGFVLAFLPVLGQGRAPQAVKALAAVVISLLLLPAGRASVPLASWQPGQFVLFAGAELVFGSLMGLSARTVFKALRIAGEAVGQQMGMALAHVADPVSGDESSLVGTFCEVVGTLAFFSVGGHLMMLRALGESFALWPLGAFLAPDFIRLVSVSAVVSCFAMALQLAAPLLLMTFTVSLTMAVMARLVPEINILILGFPVRIGVGLVGLTLFVPVLVRYGTHVSHVVVSFVSGVAAGA
jgi:flagellar biosynthetic protein FliR